MLRDGMQRLADEIVRARTERADFVSKNRRDVQRMLKSAARERRQETREQQFEATRLMSSLQEFNRNNQQRVERMLRESNNLRLSRSSHDSMARKQDIARNRRSVSRLLDTSKSVRLRTARQQEASAQQTISSVRSQVQRIKSQAKRLTKSVSDDLQASRRAWARLRSSKPM